MNEVKDHEIFSEIIGILLVSFIFCFTCAVVGYKYVAPLFLMVCNALP